MRLKKQTDEDIGQYAAPSRGDGGNLHANPRPLLRERSWPYSNAYNTLTRTLVDCVLRLPPGS